ncbi:site-specific DNA-methyltransferase [Treponema sp. OMZ 788]|uniref:site-specific DNA-methyltransferase n=1 Tax=Treponema sp. OMZ 788 TaxID=2563664 RepID=UPI0020A61864|nr:site-specific DNA-methyltransferase [Treponema sp. OMZ 788]UTC65574.1 site-specific DNA-methyltransferase [Treponema sp. OMZ 788]
MNKEEFIQEGFTVVATDNNENKLLRFLKENYPSIIKDNEIDLNELKAIAGLPIDEKVNGYGLNFVGRNFARGKYAQKTTKELKLNTQLSKNLDTTQNLVLKGDNLDSLKILKNHYTGKIKCIYIDPPYNTANDEFVYPDKFDKEEAEVLGLVNLSEDDFARMDFSFKTKKSHNGWLSFMYPRLLLARDLLSNDGVIFISIDDNEQANLKLLCDDVFGEENFVGTISVENNPKGRKNSDFISVSSEYLHIYAKSKSNAYFIDNIPKNADDMVEDEDGNFVHNSGKRVLVGENSFNKIVLDEASDKNYSVYYRKKDKLLKILKESFGQVNSKLINEGFTKYHSFNGKQLVENTYTVTKFESLFAKGALEFTEKKIFEKNFNDTIRIKSQLINKRYDAIINGKRLNYSLELTTTGAGTILKKLFATDELYFDAPKNVGYLKLLISLFEDSEYTVLDFFAGSGTTGHAVMQLNAEDGGNRKFILCQIDEPIKENKPAYQFCLDNNLPPVISSITIERLKRAGEKISEEIEEKNKKKGGEIDFDMVAESSVSYNKNKSLDLGFKVFDSVDAPKLDVDETGQISILFNDNDTLSRIYNIIFTVGLDEPTQVPEEVIKDCIYKIGNHYYITNSEKISKEDYSAAIKNALKGSGKVFIDGWTASLNGTLQNYKEDVKIVF